MTPHPLAHLFYPYLYPQENGCIEWVGPCNAGGYGMVFSGGRKFPAHRLSYEITNGPFDKRLCVLHRCDNPPCVNPDHLFLGTNLDNIADKIAKGRQRKGSQTGRAKTTEEIVALCRDDRRIGLSYRKIAEKYNLNRGVVYQAVTGAQWAHVPNPVPAGTFKPRGERIATAKLNESQAEYCFTASSSGKTRAQIGIELGVSKHAVALILRGKNWKHVYEKMGYLVAHRSKVRSASLRKQSK